MSTNASSATPAPAATLDSAVADRILRTLAETSQADECLSLAAEAEADPEVQRQCLQRAIGLDRDCQAALISLAALSFDDGDPISTYALLEEAARVGPLTQEVDSLRQQLLDAVRSEPQAEHYLRAIGRTGIVPAGEPLRILLVTRSFCLTNTAQVGVDAIALARALRARGHEVKVLTGQDTPEAEELAGVTVLRSLGSDAAGLRDNAARIRTAVTKSGTQLVLALDLTGLGVTTLQPALEKNLPVIHLLGTARPAFSVDEQPAVSHYSMAPLSEWVGTALRNAGFQTTHMESLPAGLPMEDHFRLFLPDATPLRLAVRLGGSPEAASTAFAGLVSLKTAGVPFTAELLVGGATELKNQFGESINAAGMAAEIRSVALDTPAARLQTFARANVLVSALPTPEGVPLATLEAMAAGLAVIGPNTGGTKEAVRDDVDGLLYRSGDAQDLSRRLLELAQNHERLVSLQRAAQARAASFPLPGLVTHIEERAAQMIEELRLAAEPLSGAV